jgi:hypothetical protein
MRSIFRNTLGIVAVQVVLVAPAASGQTAEPHACSYFQASDLLRITGHKDITGRGLQASKPGELAAGTTECNFVAFSMTLTTNMTPAWFARDKKMLEQSRNPWKVESVSGLGDEAYYMWDQSAANDRSVGLVFRQGSKRLTVGSFVPADSIEATKPMLMQIAKLALPKLR